ncbi:vp91 capsid [Cryptophlebia leucotreta granulovirus]|uniref:Vp91 capsid n=1 Tax=Cryptophlebia leucotreta granulosis virus TaxID=35254 RepID=Q7T5K1_GVCL|nr:vp91 capsid [Cryptophlebia leucotreta granulovirus]AAQ21687.1 vp91 capsid [Cryptophlebia leucotreta granulovirus]
MLSASTMLIVVILLCLVFLFYNKFIVDDFDNESFAARLNVLKEYLRSADTVPNILAYVSHVDETNYLVTYFDTKNMQTIGREIYDETKEIFNFATQSFSLVLNNNNRNISSIQYVSNDKSKFIAHTDDGEVVMDCEPGVFDGTKCASLPLCDQPNINLPLTEDRLNLLLFNQSSAQTKHITDNTISHPTAYVHCDSDAKPHINECLNGERFEYTKCVYDPPLLTNGQGVVIDGDINRINTNTINTNTANIQYKNKYTKYTLKQFGEPELIPKNLKENNFANKLGPVILMNKTKIANKKFAYQHVDTSILTPTNIIDNLPPTKSESILMVPVNYVYPFDASPCLQNDVGYKFVTNRIASNQFFECLNNNNLFLHSCINNLTFNNGEYECDKEFDCEQFDDGSGIIFNNITNDNISFNTGISVCEGGKIINVTECDTGDFVADKKFSHPLSVNFEVQLPRQIFNTETNNCEAYSVRNVNVLNDTFLVSVKDHDYLSNSMVGRVSKIRDENDFVNSDMVSDFVTYSRDVGEIGLNSKTFTAEDCKNNVTVDFLDNSRYNVCNDGDFVEQVILTNEEYIDFNGQLNKLNGYKGECRYKNDTPYFDLYKRFVNNYTCLFTVPS